MYYVLAAVGLFTLLVGTSVRLKRPRDQATLHFFWLCVAFFGAFTFSFNGPFDRLDWVFYWGDAVAQALLPPLLLHFTLVFPQRPTSASYGGRTCPSSARPPSRKLAKDRAVSRSARPPNVRRPGAVDLLPPSSSVRRGSSPRTRLVERRVVLARHRGARSTRAVVFARVRDRGAGGARAGLPADDVPHGAAPAALDRMGDRSGGRAFCLRLRVAVGARDRSAPRPAADGYSARLRAADVCVSHRPLPAPGRRGHRQARARLHGIRRGDCGAWAGHSEGCLVDLSRPAQIGRTGSSPCWRRP